jgi:hypothetical protein
MAKFLKFSNKLKQLCEQSNTVTVFALDTVGKFCKEYLAMGHIAHCKRKNE